MPQYVVLPDDEAEEIKAPTYSEWFGLLLDGKMLDMAKRVQLTKAQQMASRGLRLRTKAHPTSEEGMGFYTWFDRVLDPVTDEPDENGDMPEPPEG